MGLQVVSLLAVMLVTSARAQYAGMNPMFAPNMGGGYPNLQNQQNQVPPKQLTCIGADANDPSSQIRLTMKPLNPGGMGAMGGMGHMGGLGGPIGGLGFGHMGQSQSGDHPEDWAIDGYLLPSKLYQKTGSYKLAIFSGGRTYGTCKAPALGQVLNTNMNQMGGLGGFPGMFGGGYPGFGGYPGMMGGFQGQQRANGEASNPALVSAGGTTIYSAVVRSFSFNDLVGRSIGVCQAIQGGQCIGRIAFCCSLVRDPLSASEVYVEQNLGGNQLNNMQFNPAGGLLGGGQAGALGGALVGGGGMPVGGAAIVSNGDNGLF